GGQVGVQQAATRQLAEDGEDATGTVHVFHVVFPDVGCDFAQLGYQAGQAVNVAQIKIHLAFLCRGEQVQDGVGGAADGDVHGHGIFKRLEVGDVARQHRCVAVAVVTLGNLDDGACGLQEQLLTVGVGGQCGAVAGQAQPQRLDQTVHGVGGKHAGAAT